MVQQLTREDISREVEERLRKINSRLTTLESYKPKGATVAKSVDGHHHMETVEAFNEGISQGFGYQIDFVGPIVAASRSGRRITVNVAGTGGSINFNEDAVLVGTTPTLNFTEPDAVLLSLAGTTVTANMSLYALLGGRVTGQSLIGGTGSSDSLGLRPNTSSLGGVTVGWTPTAGFAVTYGESSTITASSSTLEILYDTLTVGANSLIVRNLYVGGTIVNTGRTGTQIYGVQFTPSVTNGTVALYEPVSIVFNPSGAIVTSAIGMDISASTTPAATSGTMQGMQIQDLGSGNFTTVTGVDILSQTAGGTSTFNIRQRGTTGVNRFAAPTLIGADASPAAGVALELRAGALRMAASANNIIQDSAGNTRITIDSSAPFVTLTGSDIRLGTASALIEDSAGVDRIIFASTAISSVATITTLSTSIRINDAVGIGAAPSASTTTGRLVTSIWRNLGAGASIMTAISISGTQTANATTRYGFGFVGNYNVSGQTLDELVGVRSVLTLTDVSVSGAITGLFAGMVAGLIYGASSGSDPAVTNSAGLDVISPTDNTGGVAVITTHRGIRIRDQATVVGIGTNIGLDVAAQTAGMGVRIALAGTYSLQLSDTGATAAGGITWGTDTNLYRSAANRLKTDDALMVVGNVGFNNQTPAGMQTYAASNVTTDRTYDANATTIDELADVLGSLIADLRTIGLVA